MNRRDFLGLAALGGAGAALVSSGISNAEVIIERSLPIKNLHEDLNGYRIGFLSDLHLSGVTSLSFIKNILNRVLEKNVDILLLGGDYTWIPASASGQLIYQFKDNPYQSTSWADIPDTLHRDLRDILFEKIPPDGIIAVLGNHDLRMHPTACLSLFSNVRNVSLLRNEIKTIHRGRGMLNIVGVEDYLTGFPKLPDGISPSIPSLLLAHNPDFASELLEKNNFPFSGALCGHTHGGQIRIPGIGPIALNILDARFTEGLVQSNNKFVFTSRGVGVVGIPFRINCPPEGHVFTLSSADE